MSLRAFLNEFMARLYAEHPDMPTPQARGRLRAFLEADDDTEVHVEQCVDSALGAAWASFCGERRREAERLLSQATIERTPLGAVIHVWEQTRLPLSDPDNAPLIRNATLALLRESDQYLARYQIGIAVQRKRLAPLIAQMTIAVDETGNFEIQVHEAEALGFIDWEELAA